MTMMVLPDGEALAMEAARRIAAAAQESADARRAFRLALAGGSTPKAIYDALAKDHIFPEHLVARTRLFWGDERAVPQDHPESNVRMARERLVEPLGFDPAHVHAPDGGARNLVAEATRYEVLIRRHVPFGRAGFPAFDMILLGMGTDGHTASLFPGTRALTEQWRAWVLNDVPQLDTRRLTLTFPVINAARRVLVLVSGAPKADVLRDVLAGGDRDKYPAQRVTGDGDNVLWLVDEAAAARLPDPMREGKHAEALS